MTNSTDGKTIVYGLFNADGYECEDFLGAFESESEASKVGDEIRDLILRFYEEHMDGSEWRGSVEVRPIVLGAYHVPADAQHMVTERA